MQKFHNFYQIFTFLLSLKSLIEFFSVQGTYLKQQQIVNKLIQFLVALVGPAASKQQHRLNKRHRYVLEDYDNGSPKRFRTSPDTDASDSFSTVCLNWYYTIASVKGSDPFPDFLHGSNSQPTVISWG